MSEAFNLYPLRQFRYPVLGECIGPDVFESKTVAEIEEFIVWEGNKRKRLRDLFRVEKTAGTSESNLQVRICGDVSEVQRIGTHITKGEIIIKGNVGMHLGEEMIGGKITIQGNVGGWVGSMMQGGTIEIHGSCADYLGAPYRGSNVGVHGGGRITVYGSVGNECGTHMRNGVIRIFGSAGQFAGFRMCGGTLYIGDGCGGRVGACMAGGKIVVGGCLESLLPTFTIDSVKQKVKVEEDSVEGPFLVFLGDRAEDGRGKLYVSREKNPELTHFERLL
jgi:formylmethanofuran dehydrogenase subunit C